MAKIPKMKPSIRICSLLIMCLVSAVTVTSRICAQDQVPVMATVSEPPVLVQAQMCEAIERFQPVNPAVVFSISLGRVYCFSAFDPVFEESIVYHRWYRQDRLISNARLVLNPPKWSSFSSMQLRPADKGPWRVEIVDSRDKLLKTLRFSISD
ncbi:hypothetical protein DUF2914 [Desulfotignum phosphitoxidans DSM 13687]|uniref:DUF2914 domain-containing protein n=2 Tax=Desulfotignum phosphitoxidans TaxID=190898 RepID=S0G1N2_9BACT|nr:hypothetical protein DUF2914 [Desulfotignum phosphitoxidans DSM 13687]